MRIRIELLPFDKTLRVERGTALQDVLFAEGVEFPCGGRGRCKGCKVKVLEGWLPVTAEDRGQFTAAELEAGWRLACRGHAEGDLKIELAQWESTILADDSPFAFTPQEGLGVAIDLGTTTVVAQLIDLGSGKVLAVRAGLNAQAQYGADIMSRIEFALADHGRRTLQKLVREQVGRLVEELLAAISNEAEGGGCLGGERLYKGGLKSRSKAASRALPWIKRVVLVGNTAMHHLFCGLDLKPLAQYPFEPAQPGLQTVTSTELGWELAGEPVVQFLPCLGGFVGSDILAGILATRLHESEPLAALIDLGTNGEIVIGNRSGLLCASTAAGPAFEGARISMGMRAATGAISQVTIEGSGVRCHVLGNGAARGLCGSGLVDAVAAGLDLGWIQPNGRLARGELLMVAPPVSLSQQDVRELQLAKGAIAAGLRLLLEQRGGKGKDLVRIHLSGAFGNYINHASALRIGLLDFPVEKLRPAGNTALLGAKLALCGPPEQDLGYPGILAKTRHVSLNEGSRFQEVFAEEMQFPGR
jgi:uncharacterized 2Fe-2S/4Fe-4S cluster protein (DUF4445 family)